MDCPDCTVPLVSGFYEGARIHFCTRCQGALVSANALQAIIERHEEEIDRSDGMPQRPQSGETRGCPTCALAMSHEQFMEAVTIDRCPGCESVWLDPHELEDIQFLAEMGRGGGPR